VVFVLFGLFLPRPFFWFRVVGVVALAFSWLPDIGLGLGGTPMQLAMRTVGPLTGLASIFLGGGARQGGPPPGAQNGGPPPGAFSSAPIEQVLVLMLLHAAVAIVCIVMLTTLTRPKRITEAS